MDNKEILKDLIISCRTTCGCGGELVPYTKQTSTSHYLLTCKAFSNLYDHPLLIAIDKNSPIFEKAENWDKLNGNIEISHIIKQYQEQIDEIKQLKEKNGRLIWGRECSSTLREENANLKQKLEQIKELHLDEIFEFKSDDIKIKDYFTKEYKTYREILDSQESKK